VPNHPGVAAHDCVKFKLLGGIIHGVGIWLNIVPFVLIDNANLNATVLLLMLKQWADIRESEGKGRLLPPTLHCQVDGVGTNWGKTMFAFVTFLVMGLIFICVTYARNPVGGKSSPLVQLELFLRLHEPGSLNR
jgi:hypothetical protein